MYSVTNLSKDRMTTIRLTEVQRLFVMDETKRLGLSSMAEFIRRMVDDYRSSDKVVVPLEGEERTWVEALARELNETPGRSIRMALIHYRQIMRSPLSVILRPPDELIDELVKTRTGGR